MIRWNFGLNTPLSIKNLNFFIFRVYRIIYIDFTKTFTSKFLKLMRDFSSVPGYKISIPKSIANLMTSYKQVENLCF